MKMRIWIVSLLLSVAAQAENVRVYTPPEANLFLSEITLEETGLEDRQYRLRTCARYGNYCDKVMVIVEKVGPRQYRSTAGYISAQFGNRLCEYPFAIDFNFGRDGKIYIVSARGPSHMPHTVGQRCPNYANSLVRSVSVPYSLSTGN